MSGCQGYQELCLAARKEEKRLQEWQQFVKLLLASSQSREVKKKTTSKFESNPDTQQTKSMANNQTWRCYNCSKPGHLARDCRAPKKQRNGRQSEGKGKSAGTNQVQVLPSEESATEDKGEANAASSEDETVETAETAVLDLLFSSDSEEYEGGSASPNQ